MIQLYIHMYVRISEVKVIQLCPALCNPMDYTVHGIFQARLLEWVAVPFSRGSSQPRDQTQVSHIAGRFFTSWPPRKPKILEWVAYPFSSGSSWPRNRTRVSCFAGKFFTNWAVREARMHIYIHTCTYIRTYVCVRVLSFSGISNSCNPWTVACQAPLSMQFSRQEYWVATSYFRGSSQPSNWTQVSYISWVGRQNLYHWVTWEAPYFIIQLFKSIQKYK